MCAAVAVPLIPLLLDKSALMPAAFVSFSVTSRTNSATNRTTAVTAINAFRGDGIGSVSYRAGLQRFSGRFVTWALGPRYVDLRLAWSP